MLFHRPVCVLFPCSTNRAKVCEAYQDQSMPCCFGHKYPSWMNNACSFQKKRLFHLFCFFSVMKNRAKQNLSFIFCWIIKIFTLSQALKNLSDREGKAKPQRTVCFSSFPQHKAKAKMGPHRNFNIEFFFEILKLNKSPKVLCKSVVSTQLSSIQTMIQQTTRIQKTIFQKVLLFQVCLKSSLPCV